MPTLSSITAVQPPPTPAELKEWATNTLFISVIGMAYCGSRQAWRNKQLGTHQLCKHSRLLTITIKLAISIPDQALAGPYMPSGSFPTKAHLARAIAEENSRRLLLTSRETVRLHPCSTTYSCHRALVHELCQSA